MILIVDYKMGNLGSISNILKRAGVDAEITSDPLRLAKADRLILPGVGRFDRAMENLAKHGLRAALEDAVQGRKIPTLGICLGMQIMTGGSEEGGTEGLNWVSGRVRKFQFEPERKLTVPHMGWNDLATSGPAPLLQNLGEDRRFYFVHSYYVELDDEADVMARTEYGHPFVSALRKDNLFGVQFHPEKSHRFGLQLLKNFAAAEAR